MKLNFLSIVALFYAGTVTSSNVEANLSPQNKTVNFTENKGQVHDQNYIARPDVLFSGTAGKLTFHLKNNGISYQLNRIDSYKEEEDFKTKQKHKVVDKTTIYRVDINWLNANTNTVVKRGNALEGYNNYYLESCPNGALNVKSYERVEYENIYKGINLKWYEHEGQLKYDYLVAPHANYKQIQLQIKGAQLQLQKNGSLLLKTSLGTIEEHAPIVYQNGKKLKANYVIKGNVLSFNVENYDPNQQLIIDPAVRLWGTYYGGSSNDVVRSCVSDASGNAFIAGHTNSSLSNVIATTGSHQNTFDGGVTDAFLAKFNSSGVRQWATYYGGLGDEVGLSCCTDNVSNVYMAGNTTTGISVVIATAGSHQSTKSSINDAFLVKFDNLGVRVWGTYYGGTGDDFGYSCNIDGLGNIYMAGYTTTSSGTSISTAGSHQSTFGGGIDAFLAKFNSSGIRQWGTYYGGTGFDYGFSCTSDATGNVFLSGNTNSSTGTIITTLGSHQAVFGGSEDAFLVKFNTSGVRQWGTYYGGGDYDGSGSCSVDALGNVYLSGTTINSTGTTIATLGSHQPVGLSGTNDAFLVKFNNSGVRQWGTYYGASVNDGGYWCATDASGNIYMSGITNSNTSTLIATVDSHQPTYGGGNEDAYLVKFNSSGVRQWGTYYGGTQDERGYTCHADAFGNVYLSGFTNSSTSNIIATSGSHQSLIGGSNDGYLVKFKDCPTLGASINANTPLCQNTTLNFTATVTSTLTLNYNWQGPNSFTANIQNPSIANAGTVNAGTYTLAVNDGQGCSETTTVDVTINLKPIVTVNSGSICSGNSFTINPGGANTYTIQGGNAVVSPNSTNSYTVVGTGTNGCVSDIATSNITVFATPTIAVNSGAICSGNSFTINPSGANTYTIEGGNSVVSPTLNSTYTVAGTSNAGCVSNAFATANVTVNALPIISVNSGSICSGNSFTINPSGANTYTIQGGNVVVSPTTTSSYTVAGTSTAGCLSNTFAISSVTVNPLPTINASSSNTLICVGQSATLSATGAQTYTWLPAIPMSGVVSPSATTTYTIIGADANGCENTAVITQSVDACAGIQNLASSASANILVYPNPGNGKFTLRVPENGQLTVYNSAGLLIYNSNANSGNNNLNLELYPNGVYFIQFNSANYFYSQKIIKQ